MQILTFYERQRIEYYHRLKLSIRDVGKRLKRNHTDIVRELKRNTIPGEPYSAAKAQAKADRRATKTNKRKLETDELLHDFVASELKEGWSPELIAGRLRGDDAPPHLHGATVSHEQIYEYIYDGQGRYEDWYHLLTRKHRQRHPKRGRKPQKALISELVPITVRPEVVNERQRFGDWESDQARFKKQQERLAVQYERKGMLIRIQRVADGTAEENERAIAETLEPFPEEYQQSLTLDRGTENTSHAKIRHAFRMETFFCDPYCAWQKGGVENAIGLIRRYLPKTTDLATISDAEIHAIQEKLNNRPRKKLNYKTPNEVLTVSLGGALNS